MRLKRKSWRGPSHSSHGLQFITPEVANAGRLMTLHGRDIYRLLPEVGMRNFFWSSQSQFHNLKKNFRNRNSATLKECCSATTTLQFRNHNFSDVRNLRVSLPQFPAYYWPQSSLKLYIFFTPRCFLLFKEF